jgi:hypothetical protein
MTLHVVRRRVIHRAAACRFQGGRRGAQPVFKRHVWVDGENKEKCN